MSTAQPQHWNPAQYGKNARFVSDLGLPVVELLGPRPGERVLDLGCGDGALTIKLAQRGCRMVGVDASAEMIAAAKALGLDAHVQDGQGLGFEREFDAVFSNAALHWMQQPRQVIRGVARALKPGGRFVGEFGGHGNVATIVGALEMALKARSLPIANPWFFPRPEAYQTMLEAEGFEVQSIELIPRPTLLPGDIGAWLETFAQSFSAPVQPADRPVFIAEVVQFLRPRLCDAKGDWYADYVRLRFAARKASVAA